MKFFPRLILLFALFAPPGGEAIAQDFNGVNWELPLDFRTAAEDLLEMHSVGIRSVRTGLLFDEALFELADSLGLTFYRELPFVGLGAGQLSDSLASADSLLGALLRAGANHVSAGPIGLVQFSDTSSPTACSGISRSAELVRRAGKEAYYSSVFIKDDACSGTVDFVLLDALGHPDPMQLLEAFSREHEGEAGLARVGVAAVEGMDRGWINEGSPEAQARFFETLLAQSKGSGRRIFIHRWRDEASPNHLVPDPYGRRFGLYSLDSEPRAALQVVRGFFQGVQKTFAFDRGLPAPRSFPWFLILGWTLIGFVSVMYASSLRFRSMIPRYFFAHGFFRNAVREAREVLPITSTAILTITGLSIGLIATFIVNSLRETRLAWHIFSLLTNGTRDSVISILDAPFVLSILMGSVALISISIWMGLWMIVSGRRTRLLPSQALMLAVWPRWQVILILPVAMTLHAAGEVPVWSVLMLGAAWVGTAYSSALRTTIDLFKIANIRIGMAVLVWLMNPLVLASIVATAYALTHRDAAALLWSLMVQS